MKYYIGCSGFSYKEWKDAFYPNKLPQKQWFAYYSTQFNSLELNVTFYRFPRAPMLSNWYDQSPEDFLFAVKAPRLITHYKKFHEAEGLMQDFYGAISAGLKNKLGPVLFQLPRQLTYSAELLDRIVGCLDPQYSNAVEFRDASWWTESVQKTLAENKIIFCGISHPDLPPDLIRNTGAIYYRYHGVPRLYYSEYTVDDMRSMAHKLAVPEITQAYIYFNNTASGAAIQNAMQLKRFLGLDNDPRDQGE